MGLFSGDYETKVGTSVNRVIEDDMLPNSVRTGVLKAILKDGDVSEYVMEELVASMGIRSENYYKYGKNRYIHGVPSGERVSSTQGTAEVREILSQLEGTPVLMDYCHFARSNTLHIGWMKLISQYGYSESTNQLATMTAAYSVPVYLKDMEVVIPESMVASREVIELAQWGQPANTGYTPERTLGFDGFGDYGTPTPINVSPTDTEEYVKVTVVYQKAPNPDKPLILETYEEVFNISVSEYDNTEEYFHAKYYVNGQAKYWIYQYGSGVYVELDTIFDTVPREAGTYYPMAYFRYNKTSELDNPNTEEYRSSKNLVNKLGLDYDTIAEAINENPDIKDVEQAMLIMAVPANTTNLLEQRYLFEFFDKLYEESEGSFGFEFQFKPPTIAYMGLENPEAKTSEYTSAIIIQDKRFKLSLVNDGIHKKRVAGKIGDVGFYNSELVTTPIPQKFIDKESGEIFITYVDQQAFVYRKQVTANVYEEIRVVGLRLNYFIFKKHKEVAKGTEKSLLIPLDRSIIDNYTLIEKEEILCRAMHFVFNSRVTVYVEWYETGVFKIFLVILAIAWTVYSYGADGGSTISAALGLTGAQGLIATIVVNLVIGAVLPVVFKLFVKAFGTEIATLVLIVAVAYGAYQGFQLGSLTKIPYASELLMLVNGLESAILNAQMEDLVGDYKEYTKYMEEQTKLLEEAKDLLNQSPVLNPFIIFGEKPEDYYNRTIHSGNIGVLGVDAVAYYCDIALTLPTIQETLGGT